MATNYITYRCYSKDEINFIKENYTGDKNNVLFLAEKLKRSMYSIREQARKLGLTVKAKREKVYNTIPLTKREKEILILLYKGLSIKEIANKCFITENTARCHKTNILCKMDANSVIELMAKRIEELENNQLSDLAKNLIAEKFLEKLKQNTKEFIQNCK